MLQSPQENPDRTNFGMLDVLLKTMSDVIDIGEKNGVNVEAAIAEVRRQMQQFADNVPITKSGEEN